MTNIKTEVDFCLALHEVIIRINNGNKKNRTASYRSMLNRNVLVPDKFSRQRWRPATNTDRIGWGIWPYKRGWENIVLIKACFTIVYFLKESKEGNRTTLLNLTFLDTVPSKNRDLKYLKNLTRGFCFNFKDFSYVQMLKT